MIEKNSSTKVSIWYNVINWYVLGKSNNFRRKYKFVNQIIDIHKTKSILALKKIIILNFY